MHTSQIAYVLVGNTTPTPVSQETTQTPTPVSQEWASRRLREMKFAAI